MTGVLKTAASQTSRVNIHVASAAAALDDYRAAGVNAAGILMNPCRQIQDLRAARDELDRAIAVATAANWPSEADYHAL